MKKLITLSAIVAICLGAQAQTTKLTVKEDAFIQGGNTSDTAFGETSPKNLRIFNSEADSKYARITYLKFETPKKLNKINKATLHIPLKVYENKSNPEATFHLEVYAVENDKWRELSITWSDKLALGALVGSMEVPQSKDGKNQKLTISLDAAKVSELFNGKKDRKITLALVNTNFNKISSMAPSKEQSPKSASYLIIE